ncbi:MAG: alpha/beta hydrolase [Planctomycetes bacterium]|nr:alpha/beta hydrolase [Planctomycetota bacterium]
MPSALRNVAALGLLVPWVACHGAAVPPYGALLAESFTLPSACLTETRRVNVYTPPGYTESATTAFPVLYMPDGGLAEDFVHVAEAVHTGIQWGLVRPMLVVGIENTARRRDLTGPTEAARDRAIAPVVGGSAAFRSFLRDELMPEVARRYRVTDETGLIGESLAGLFVVETFLLEPALFDHCIAFDPSLWWNDRALVRTAAERLRGRPELRATLYLANSGEPEIAAATKELTEAIAPVAPRGLAWSWQPMPEQFHDTIYRAAAPLALRSVFAAPAEAK